MSLFLNGFSANLCSVPVARDDDGRLVLVKRAGRGPAADRLRREAEALELAAGAGCAELVALVEEADGGVRLVTAWVGGGTLATARPVAPARLLDIARALAASLAELHRRGLVHGAVTPEHVLLEGDRPVLCGLAGARLPGDDGGPSADEDVAALLTMVEGLLADVGGPLAERLRAVVAAGGGGGAAAVADRFAAVVPADRPRREVRPRRAPPERRSPVRGLVVIGATAVVLLALTMATWRSTLRSGPPAAPSTTALTAAPGCPTAPRPSVDVDGNGCPEAVGVAGGVVTVGDRRWRVGDRDDLAAVADWDCDGRATAAVVRPATGEVWVYDRWASAGRPVTAHRGPDAPGATAARAVRAGDGCARLEVTMPTGDRRLLDLG